MSGNASENKGMRRNAQPDWYAQGLPHVWLPYSQMKTANPPLAVAATNGCRITLADGRELVDGIASWWTACHGYNHPHIRGAIEAQLGKMPHVMFGGLVHEPALTLAQRLTALMAPADLSRVFFSDSGSVAVEVALKMAVQYWLNRGRSGRSRFLAFSGGYHGDTTGAMALCDPEHGMHAVFAGLLPQQTITDLPRSEEELAALDALLARQAETLAGIVVEPLVQGAGGMIFHESAVLQKLRALADKYDLLLIFDEIFTGFGRTGKMFAFQEAGVVPDILTLSKALTGGTLPLAATLASKKVFDAFWSDDPAHALMHGPTFMANALACAAANASLDLFEREPRLFQVAKHFGDARSRPGTMPRASRRQRCPRQRRHRRGRARPHRRPQCLAATLCCRRCFHPAIRQHRLSDPGFNHRRRGRRQIDGRYPPRARVTPLIRRRLT